MALRSAPSISSLPRNALVYVTVGALLVVWTGVWYAVYHDGPISQSGRFWLLGLFFTGLALIVIGVVMGPLARYERDSELPPIETTGVKSRVQETAPAQPSVPVVPRRLEPGVPTTTAAEPAPPLPRANSTMTSVR